MGELVTERLRLRMCADSDADAWAQLCADPNFWRYPFGRGFEKDESADFLARFTRHWEELGFGLWAATTREGGVLIGFIGLAVPSFLPEILPAVEIGWRLGSDWWGQGLATEGGRAALTFGFEELRLDRIVCIAEPENVASLRVAEKLGMERERETVDPALGVPLVVMEIQRAQWESPP